MKVYQVEIDADAKVGPFGLAFSEVISAKVVTDLELLRLFESEQIEGVYWSNDIYIIRANSEKDAILEHARDMRSFAFLDKLMMEEMHRKDD